MSVLLIALLQIATLVLLARAILSWFPSRPGSALYEIQRGLVRITEPVVAPVRSVVPRIGGLDLSILVLLLAINVVLIPALATL